MEWTLPSAIFFIVIFLILVGMAIWQSIAPSAERRGFLPIPTTPGDRSLYRIIKQCLYFSCMGWIN
jgi:predicted small integral membrane protein